MLTEKSTDGVSTRIYQINKVWTKKMPYLINVVIITRTIIASGKTSRVVLFSTDPELEGNRLTELYSLRFQIEFNFRDAKQYVGLANFKNIKQRQVYNAVGLSLFMNNISLLLLDQARQKWQQDNLSIQDLKAYYRAEKYIDSIFNTLEIQHKDILNQQQIDYIRAIGAVNRG